jgi:hypothetical protein
MKLQYLGDARDAFKWDLLHWLCTRSPPAFEELVFMPLLTPDEPGSGEGRTPHAWFPCREFVRPFVESLRCEPRDLTRVCALGSLDCSRPSFRVSIHGPGRILAAVDKRAEYWADLGSELHANAIVFLDPDNGFETKTQHGAKWVRHSELAELLAQLPDSSIVVVYQHRPRLQKWAEVFAGLSARLDYARLAVAAYEGDLAFVVLANCTKSGVRARLALEGYVSQHRTVRSCQLR